MPEKGLLLFPCHMQGEPRKDFSDQCFNRKQPKPDTRSFHHLTRALGQGTPPSPVLPPSPGGILGSPPGPSCLPSHLRSFALFATRLSMASVNHTIIERPRAGPGRFLCRLFSFHPQRHFGTFPRQKAEGRKEVPPCGHRKDNRPLAPGVPLQACAEPPTRSEPGSGN